ncbi:MAG: hypothetical protein QOJ09_1906 [Actinomycetota bacterium]|nr:hypothetical protein [Actinomycetota bacterium]
MRLLVASAKDGAVTTSALALAAAWPTDRQVVVVEADVAGGDIAVRFGLPLEPGLVSLAAAARRTLSADAVMAHSQRLPGGLPVVVAPASADQCQAALRALSDWLGELAPAEDGVDVIIDGGRLGAMSSSLARWASVTAVVARPSAEEVARLHAVLPCTRDIAGEVGLVLVGDRPYGPAEVAAALEVPVYGVLAVDGVGASVLAGRSARSRALTRSPLLESARALAAVLTSLGGPRLRSETSASSRRGSRDGDDPDAAVPPRAAQNDDAEVLR